MFFLLTTILVTISLDALVCLIPFAIVAIPLALLLADNLITRSELDTTEQVMIELIARKQHNDSCLTTLGVLAATLLIMGVGIAMLLLFFTKQM